MTMGVVRAAIATPESKISSSLILAKMGVAQEFDC